ncbi:hypothetical protein BGI41_00475 [Methanobrevibacter sp. 87.7]|uniref:DUF2142 domain-containing protein n=1 Tax=Methanobrevibacter sp. 87.7 TaxID=387957 RepID=UPI000B50F2B6|nr:DUF2142 domain-containing protein [Methanobrevibacter sp. 87.7]OWT33825.1 hypothetical protein BGI41_00475 [Methanobrevibacter sp. 87.7]
MNKLENIFNKNRNYILIYLICLIFFSFYQYYFYGNFGTINREIGIFIILTIVGIFCLIYNSLNKDKLHKVAFIITILFGIITLLLSPLLIGCDESEHLNRAELTSLGVINPQYITINNNTGYKVEHFCSHLTGTSRFNTVFTTNWDDEKIDKSIILQKSAFAHNPFYAYLPQGFGIWLAKELNLNSIWVLWLGGLFNLLMYGIVSSYAIKKTPILKTPMLLIACLPFAVYQGTTVSSDAFVNSFSLLLMAYFFSMYKAKEKSLSGKNSLIFMILCISVGFLKPPLLLFIFLILLVPQNNFKNKNNYRLGFILILAVFIIGGLWNVFYAMPQSMNSFRGPRAKLLPVDAKLQLKFLLGSMNHIIIIFQNILSQTWYVIKDIFRFADWQGTQLYASTLMAIVFSIYYLIISFISPEEYKLSIKRRTSGIIIFIIIYFAFFIVQYLTWSRVGQLTVTGVQGRYFIPLLMLLPFLLNINSKDSENKIKPLINKEELNNLTVLIAITLLGCLQLLTIGVFY